MPKKNTTEKLPTKEELEEAHKLMMEWLKDPEIIEWLKEMADK